MSDEGVKTGILSKIGGGAIRRDEYSTADRIGCFDAFKLMWTGNFTKMLFVSLLTLIFIAPAIAWVIVQSVIGVNVGLSVPYNMFDGVGYPGPGIVGEYGLNAALELGNLMYYRAAMLQYSVLIPCAGVAGVGIAAMAYVARLFMYGSEVKIVRTYFRGVVTNWAAGLIGGLLCGAATFLLIFTNHTFTLNGWGMAGRVFAIIACALLITILAIYSSYLITLSSSYKMGFFHKLRDAATLTFVYFPRNFIACLVAAAVIGALILLNLMFASSSMSMLPWVVMFFVGFYAIVSAFVAVSQSAFAKYIAGGLAERETKLRNEQYYAAKRELKLKQKAAAAAGEAVPAKKQPAHYVNPKKKKSGKGSESESGAVRSDEKQPVPEHVKGYTAKELEKMEEDRRKVAELAAQEKTEASGLEDLSAYEDDGE